VNSGIIWEALGENGQCTVADPAKATSLSREEVHGAHGRLGRENKISVEMRGEQEAGCKSLLFAAIPSAGSLGAGISLFFQTAPKIQITHDRAFSASTSSLTIFTEPVHHYPKDEFDT
jgi:hypothetical protein